MTRRIWALGIIILSVAVLLILWGNGVTAERYREEIGICQTKYIRHNLSNLDSLRGCKVIEGSLQLALLNPNAVESWSSYSYPELMEITGYLLIFEVYNLTSLGNLFPNLAVIRGHQLINNYSLVISSGNQLEEIGLRSLTVIEKGSVWIKDNRQLCYVDSVNWSLITNSSTGNVINSNKPSAQCPNMCHKICPMSDDGSRLCWGRERSSCQKVWKEFCPLCHGKPCTDKGECCSDHCIGGCTGTSSRDCHACKNLFVHDMCTDECPHGFYEYLKRRCVTYDECLRISVAHSTSNGSTEILRGKIYEVGGKRECVSKCPTDTETSFNKTTCVPCVGTCKVHCPGMQVDTIEKARKLEGCTRINGSLKISIRRVSGISLGTVVKALTKSLGKIEEIDGHIEITNMNYIRSLDFLENLEIVHGNGLQDERYALVVRSNENLKKLWTSRGNKRIRIGNQNARVLFVYNSKLCPEIILDFVAQSGIRQSKNTNAYNRDVGTTNGDRAICNQLKLKVEVGRKANNSVLIRYENFRNNLTLSSHLLGYEVFYKETVNVQANNVPKYADRDPGEDGNWFVLEYPKMRDIEVGYTEPTWEHSRLVTNLKSNTWYALYVKTIVIPYSTRNQKITGAESNIIYFQTLPSVPSKPQNFSLVAITPNQITLSWSPPVYPNGRLDKFNIWVERPRDQSNYCPKWRYNPGMFSYNDGMMNLIMRRLFITEMDNPSENFENVFPSWLDLNDSRVTPEMIKVKEINVTGDYNYSITLNNFAQSTTYKVGIQACRFIELTISPEIENESATCSDLTMQCIRTS